MRRLGGIWPQVVSFENLLLAYRKARRGKGRSPDVARYFPSIDHEILKEKLRRRVKDRRVLALLDRIIDTSPPTDEPPVYFPGDDLLTPFERRRGLPIGNLTSQFLANLYLDDLDHHIKRVVPSLVCPYLFGSWGQLCEGYSRFLLPSRQRRLLTRCASNCSTRFAP
jgi:hypothetical protein